MPDSLMLYFFITSINGHIEFARMEKRGNEYQRPLEDLLQLIPKHRHDAERARAGGAEAMAQLAAREKEIDRAFDRLEEVNSRLGTILQFTDEGLAKRKRQHYRVQIVRKEWDALKAAGPQILAASSADQHRHLVQDVRVMITHAGDLSNLILDPDLDSYYLMDATLLALPQTQDRLAQIVDHSQEILARGALSEEDRRTLHTNASLLREADFDRIVASIQTGLNEDRNFYDLSPSLQERVPPALEKYRASTSEFINLMERLVTAPDPESAAREYVAAGNRAREASFELWHVTCDELDVLLDIRIHAYQHRRLMSLIVAGFAALAAIGFVTFITRSISGPLRQQALDLGKANTALEAEIIERRRAEDDLRHSETQLAAAQIIARIGSWAWDQTRHKLEWSDENFRIHGYKPGEIPVEYEAVLQFVHPDDRDFFDSAFRQAVIYGKPFSFEQRIIRRDGTERVLHQRGDVVRGEDGRVTEVFGTAQDITERKQAEEALEKVHRELLEVSRRAGMAEVATGVLHNVGNVLNSVNVSALLITDRLSKSRVAHVTSVAQLLRDHSTNLGQFFTTDSRGQQLPAFVGNLAERLSHEQAQLLHEAETLSRNIAHIKDIVAVQQNYAKVSGVTELLPVVALVEDALEMNGAAFERHSVIVRREYSEVPPVRVDKHKVLQILINVLSNAKYAVSESSQRDKRITIRVGANGDARVKVAITDNGIGIAPENVARIFAHGFTTKRNGHGFGLHSAALAAKEMGGSLSAESPGLGLGATFVLELPLVPPAASEPAAPAPASPSHS